MLGTVRDSDGKSTDGKSTQTYSPCWEASNAACVTGEMMDEASLLGPSKSGDSNMYIEKSPVCNCFCVSAIFDQMTIM